MNKKTNTRRPRPDFARFSSVRPDPRRLLAALLGRAEADRSDVPLLECHQKPIPPRSGVDSGLDIRSLLLKSSEKSKAGAGRRQARSVRTATALRRDERLRRVLQPRCIGAPPRRQLSRRKRDDAGLGENSGLAIRAKDCLVGDKRTSILRKKQASFADLQLERLPLIPNPQPQVRSSNRLRQYSQALCPGLTRGGRRGTRSIGSLLSLYESCQRDLRLKNGSAREESMGPDLPARSEAKSARTAGRRRRPEFRSMSRPGGDVPPSVDRDLCAGVVGQHVTEFSKLEKAYAIQAAEENEKEQEEEDSVIDGILADNNDEYAQPQHSSSPPEKKVAVALKVPEPSKVVSSQAASAVDSELVVKTSATTTTRQPNWTITPGNLEEQERLFFASGARTNPQFHYDNPRLAQHMLRFFQRPGGLLLPLAIRVIEEFLKEHVSETNFLTAQGGEIMTVEETKAVFLDYIDKLGLGHLISLQFSPNTVSPTTIVHDSRTGLSVIRIGLPVEYRKNRIIDVLNHEIGTHFLRKYNDQFQLWHGGRCRLGLRSYIATEEGLASLNQIYEQAVKPGAKPFLFRSALYYYTCCRASELSFVELYQDLERYVDDPKRRFGQRYLSVGVDSGYA